jgi:phage terminase large subunit-like protein
MAANRVGKTEGAGGFELTCHLTGRYPDWWEGRRFAAPIRAWAAGKTNETTRDVPQLTLLGPVVYEGDRKSVAGTGLIRGGLLDLPTWKPDNLVDIIRVRHVAGGWSTLGFKAYTQGRGSFEGTAQHCIWLDEEPPMDVYGECLIRTATTNGIMMLTFTPKIGMSKVVLQFMPKEYRPDMED